MDKQQDSGAGENEFVFEYGDEDGADDDGQAELADSAEAPSPRQAPPLKKLIPIALAGSVLALVGTLWFVAPEMLPGADLVAGIMGSEESTDEAPAEDAPVEEAPAEDSPAEEAAAPAAPSPRPRQRDTAPPRPVQQPVAVKRDIRAGEAHPIAKAGRGGADRAPAQPSRIVAKPKAVRASKGAVVHTRRPVATTVPSADRPVATAVLSFAPGSTWVAAREIEKLWSFSTGVGAKGGRLQVEALPGAERGGSRLARERAERVAGMLQRNNRDRAIQVTVRVAASGTRGRPQVVVSCVKKL